MRKLASIFALACCVSACNSYPIPTLSVAATSIATSPQVQAAETTLKQKIALKCGTVPTADTITALLDAAQGKFTVNDIATTACTGFNLYSAVYSASTRHPLPPKRPAPGTVIDSTVTINGKAVPIRGTVGTRAK